MIRALRRIAVLIGVGAFVTPTGAQAAAVPGSESDSAAISLAEIARARRGFVRALEGNLATRIANQFTPEANIVTQRGTVDGPRFADLMVALNISGAQFNPDQVEPNGVGRVTERGRYRYYSGSRFYDGSYEIVWLRDARHGWRITHYSWFPTS